MAPSDAWCVTDRPLEIFARGSQRLLDGMAERKVRRDRRCKRAPGSVCVAYGQSRPPQLELSVPADDEIDRIGSVEVPALHYYDAWAERQDSPSRRPHVLEGLDWHLGQH